MDKDTHSFAKAQQTQFLGKLSPLPAIEAEYGVEMHQMLQMMEKLLHWAAIIESSDDAIISKSMEGYITSWNKGAQRLYGYTPEEVIGKPVSILMPPEREDDFPKIMNALMEGRKVEHYETKRRTKDGRVLDVSITVSPIKDTNGTIIGASKIARDITDRKEGERRRNAFVSTASHELKTPITSQKVYGELLEQLIVKNGHKEYLPYIQKINLQTSKLEKLITDLLELSRLQSGRLKLAHQAYSVDSVVEEAVDQMRHISKHKIVVQGDTGVQLVGDAERITQVVVNLLSNAIKYSPQSDKVIVTKSKDEEKITISVQDFGIGIDPEYHQRIFERFFRVDDDKTYPGMGIGLDFSREIAQRHGGTISVNSRKGKGATFYLQLPLHSPEEQDEEPVYTL